MRMFVRACVVLVAGSIIGHAVGLTLSKPEDAGFSPERLRTEFPNLVYQAMAD